MSSLSKWFEAMGWWSAGILSAGTVEKIAVMPADEEAEVVAALRPHADACPAESKYASSPHFRFHAQAHTRETLQDFQMLAYLLGTRRSADGLSVLRSLFREHRADDVRLTAGHIMLMYPGTADEVAHGASELAATSPGWFRLWAGAELVRSPTSFEVIEARRVAAADPAIALTSMLEAGALLRATGPAWCELCATMLGEWRPNFYALRILAQNKDHRMIPALATRLNDPDYGTVSAALELLAICLGADDELPAAVIEIYDKSSRKDAFEAAFASMPAGRKLVERRQAQRLEAVLKQEYPFRFFGAKPAHWYEGANDGHLYIVCFEGTLDAAKLEKLAKAVAKLPKRAAIAKRAWLFGELDGNTWAYFYCGGKPFEQLRTSLPAIHKSVKLREVIFGGVRELDDDDDWTLWSQHQPGVATRVPKLDAQVDTRLINFFRGREIVPVEGRVDDTFEAARTAPKPKKAT